MALRIFQFGIVFAIGFYLGPASSFEGDVGVIEIPLSIQLKDPRDVTVNKGQSATLQCDVKSFPSSSSSSSLLSNQENNVKISWFFNGNPIFSNDTKRRIVEGDDGDGDGSGSSSSTLFIPKVIGGKRNNGVQGEYQCLVSSQHGSVLSNPAKVRIGSFDHISAHPANLTVQESQPAVLFCNIHSVPAAQIEWEFNDKELPRDTRYVPLPTGALLITKTHSSDAGSYRCKATNSLFNKINHSKTVQLIITSGVVVEEHPPTFLPLDISPNTTVLLGDNATLYCAVTGWPLPTVQWLNNDIVIGNSSVLQRRNVSFNDSGNYTCTSYNKFGRIYQKYSLQVHQKPYFNITPTSKRFPSAITVRLDCQALGVPEPRIHWLKNGKPLEISGRIKKQQTGLVFSHTFTYDSGIYQCIAVNSAGRVWTAAQLVLQSATTPSPPEDVQCRPFDENRICLTWRSPKNVRVQAYTIYTLIAVEPEILGPEYITNNTFVMADNLNSSTNYKFYIRLFSNAASDNSNTVTCETGVKGNRSLYITSNSEKSVQLKWSKISTDVPCNGTNHSSFKVMWRAKGRSSQIYSAVVRDDLSHVVSDLSPNVEYEFRVVSYNYLNENAFPWQTFTTPGSSSVSINNNENNSEEVDEDFYENTSDTVAELTAPERLEANAISTTVVNLTWSDNNANTKYYTICSMNLARNDTICTESKSSSNISQVSGLQPGTLYKFKVKTHSVSGRSSPFSESVEIHTPVDVPSPVLHLKYKVLNETAACLLWQPPIHKHIIINYIILYSPDQNWPLDKWHCKTVTVASQKKSKGCWSGNDDETTFSTLLSNLKPNKHYTVFVRADSQIGFGKLTQPLLLKTDNTERDDTGFKNSINNNNNNNNDQTYGIILGVVIALLCIIVCVACIVVRKRCIKSRQVERGGGRMTAAASNSNDYYPAAHYTSEGNSVHVRFSHPCNVEIHEIEHLVVAEDTSPGIPTVIPAHLDTKGNDGFPNGHLNGSAKSYTNGHVVNGDVRITENPRYGVVYHEKKCDDEELLPCIDYDQEEEDSNSNLKGSKFKDLHRIYEDSKEMSEMTAAAAVPTTQKDINNCYNGCNSHLIEKLSNDLSTVNNISFRNMNSSLSSSSSSSSSSDDEDGLLNATQVTCLDNSFITTTVNNHHRRVSPIVGPNG